MKCLECNCDLDSSVPGYENPSDIYPHWCYGCELKKEYADKENEMFKALDEQLEYERVMEEAERQEATDERMQEIIDYQMCE